MKHEEAINRMLENGILTEKKAASLTNSLNDKMHPDKRNQKRSSLPLFLLAAGLGVVVLFMFLANSPPLEPQLIQDVSESLNQPGVTGNMNPTLAKLFALVIFLIFPLLLFVWLYNSLVTEEEKIHEAWSQVESNYQRRGDLIPNLVETVGNYMKYEAETLQNITDQRSQNWQASINDLIDAERNAAELMRQSEGQPPSDENQLAALQQAQQRMGSSMRQVFALAENYPQLRSSDQMLHLQAQLEGTENRINVARMRFNAAVSAFNASLRRLPTSLVAATGDFQRKAYFKADDGSDEVNEIQFE